jgi:hypothetical protein
MPFFPNAEDLTDLQRGFLRGLLRYGGIAAMKADPEKFKALNPSNGWGDHDSALAFLERVLAACEAHPLLVIDNGR